MDDLRCALERLKAQMEEAEIADMSSVKVGDIIYVPLDEEDGLTLTHGYDTRRKYIVIIEKLESLTWIPAFDFVW